MNQSSDGKKIITPGHARYVLFILFVVYVFNFADRYILIVVQSSIKEELGLSDQQLGLLTGLAFAMFYTVVGLPIARWADRSSRTMIMSLGLTVWSGLTAVCGLAQNFVHLLLALIRVGVGEATATPCAHSRISDYYPLEKRAKAIGLYSIGANIGMFVGMLAGGLIAQKLGWRAAFYIVGLPGIILAIIVKFTVKEPPRGYSDNRKKDSVENLPLKDTLKYLFGVKSFRYLCIAGSIAALSGFGMMNWSPVFFERLHGMTKQEVGPVLGVIIGIIGGISTLLGGILADKLSKRTKKWYMWLAGLGVAGMMPFCVFFILVPNKNLSLLGIAMAYLIGLLYSAPTFSTVQGLAKPDMRALASAIFLFLINLIGMGLGPYFVGLMSDLFAPAFGKESLRYALLVIMLVNVLSIGFYFLAARTLPEDLEKALE